MVEGRIQKIVLPSETADSAPMVLYVKPLSGFGNDESDAEQSRFIAIEVLSGSVFQDLANWQQQFAQQQSAQIESHIETLRALVSELENAEQPTQGESDACVAIAGDVIDWLKTSDRRLPGELPQAASDFILIDTAPILQAVAKKYEKHCTRKNVKLRQELSKQAAFAACNPIKLDQAFQAMIECMLREVEDEMELVITSELTRRMVCYTMLVRVHADSTNASEPMALEGSLLGMTHDDFLSQSQLEQLTQIDQTLKQWGGSLEVTAAANFRVSLKLSLSRSLNLSRVIDASSVADKDPAAPLSQDGG